MQNGIEYSIVGNYVGVVEYLKVAVILSSALKLQNPDYVMLIFSAI